MTHLPIPDFKDHIEKTIDDLQAKVAQLESELATKDAELQIALEELSCDDAPDIRRAVEAMTERLRDLVAMTSRIGAKRLSSCDDN